MMTVSKIREQLLKPSVKKDKMRSIELARRGVKITTGRSLNEWFLFRYMLAQFLLKRDTGIDVNTAIRLMTGVRKRISQTEHPRMWADTCLILGAAYERKQTGDRNQNITKALDEL